MTTVDIIARKQAGVELDSSEIHQIIAGCVKGNIPDYQLSALLMAIYFQGMTRRETADLTKEMIASGAQARHTTANQRRVDKHSTGGVGDKTSLLIAPIVASLGVPVPMMSGRGLGHTGGTLDKLESIPGFTTSLKLSEFEKQVAQIGCALIGQSDEITPADRKLYALRDVTSTVRSIPLITASIISKKVAEGCEALLLDVKFGKGAFLPALEGARDLARNLIEIGADLGLEVQALLTDMNQPLGSTVGNWLEVKECLDILKGEAGATDLVELALAESALMLEMGGRAEDYNAGLELARESLKSGAAYEKFLEIARSQNADASYLEDPSRYPGSRFEKEIAAKDNGYIEDIDALLIGTAAVKLGAGRQQQDDSIDYSAGFVLHKKRGDRVEKGESLVTIHASSEKKIESIISDVLNAYSFTDNPPEQRPLIDRIITETEESTWEY